MTVKAETIEQFGGFGNLIPKTENEHFRSCGFVPSANGMVAGRNTYSLTTGRPTHYTQTDFANFDPVNAFADGYGRDEGSVAGSNSYTFALTDGGEIWQSLSGVVTPELVYPANKNGSHFASGGIGGMIVDQKKRLLFAGQRYLGMFDPAVSDASGSATFTNGATTISGASGDAFVSGDVGKFLRVAITGGTVHYYRISAYTSGTAVTLASAITATTGTYSYIIMRSWTEQWKDFGANFLVNSEGNSAYTPTETYEDTVLFGRGSNITSLNTLTDTVTTDASPAFNMPEGFDCLAIHKGSNGILIASNFQRKGVLILWDNYSDRSIAPWINLGDRIISVCKYNGGWIVITTREIVYTNGYSVTPLIDSFLDSSVSIYASNLHTQTSFVIENDLYCTLGFSYYSGKRRAGVYKINLTSKLAHYLPRADMNQYDEKTTALFYGGGNGSGRVYIGTVNSWDAVTYDTQPTVATFITSPVGKGENWKYAEALKVNLGISNTHYDRENTFSFKIIAKIAPMTKQITNYGALKVAMTDLNKITVNESTYYSPEVGEEVEFVAGTNAGYCRKIVSKTGGGTATAVWTLDRDLPTLDTNTSNIFFVYPFRQIAVKTYTDISEMPEVYFNIKNKVKGKKFLIKIDLEGMTVPVELRTMLFMYDDLGVL